MSSWVSGSKGERFVGWLIFSGGALIAVPAANLPFNDTLPALMVIFACIGWLERDGLMVVVSLAWGAATFLYFTALIVALYFFGAQFWTHSKFSPRLSLREVLACRLPNGLRDEGLGSLNWRNAYNFTHMFNDAFKNGVRVKKKRGRYCHSFQTVPCLPHTRDLFYKL